MLNNKHGLNLESESYKMYDAGVILGASNTTYPDEFQLARNASVLNQLNTGACLAHVLATIAEYYYGKKMSPGWNYGEFRTSSQKNPGLYPSTALDAFKNIGQVPLSDFGTLCEMRDIRELTQNNPELKEIAKKYQITGYASLNYAMREKRDISIKDFLTKYPYPLIGAADNYFHEPHAIAIDGWNDKTGCYKFQNSWGEDWGDGGYGEIPKDRLSGIYAVFFEPIVFPFKDVPETHWGYKDIKSMYFNGLINGVSDTSFEPESFQTRAQTAAMLNRLCTKLDNQNIRQDKTISMLLNRIIALENKLK